MGFDVMVFNRDRCWKTVLWYMDCSETSIKLKRPNYSASSSLLCRTSWANEHSISMMETLGLL